MSSLTEYENLLSDCIIRQKRPLIHINTSDFSSEDLRLGEILGQGIVSKELSCGGNHIWGWTPALLLHNYYQWCFDLKEHNTYSKKYIFSPDHTSQQDSNNPYESDDNAFSNLTRCIIKAYESDSPIMLIIKEIDSYFNIEHDNKEALTMLCSLLYLFSISNENKPAAKRSMIVIMSPQFDIPLKLQGSLFRITPPYPDDEDIERELGLFNCSWEELKKQPTRVSHSRPETVEYRYCPFFWTGETKSKNEETFEKNRRRLVSLFKGMRIRDIVSILSYNNYTISSLELSSYRENKERMVQDSGLLKVEDVEKGYEHFVGDIDNLTDYIKERKRIIDNRSLYNPKMSLPKGILLVGPPGCGKSEATKAIASILDMPLISLEMGKLLSKWSGESEHNFDEAISIAEAAQPCVLRIDEIEKAFVGSGEQEGDQSMTRIIGRFLTWMQERKKMVYIVATANNLDMMRPEFLRKGRWDEIYYLSYPTAQGAIKILESCFTKYGFDNIVSENHKENRERIKSFFYSHKSLRLSGAEINDVVIQAYQKLFLKCPESFNSDSLDLDHILAQMETLAAKDKDIELKKKVREELDSMELEWEIQRREQMTPKQEQDIRLLLKDSFSKVEIDKQIRQMKVNLSLGNIPFEKKRSIAEGLLLKKYKDDGFEAEYKSKGFIPASKSNIKNSDE